MRNAQQASFAIPAFYYYSRCFPKWAPPSKLARASLSHQTCRPMPIPAELLWPGAFSLSSSLISPVKFTLTKINVCWSPKVFMPMVIY